MKSTVFLPNTKFLARIKSSERARLDSTLSVLGRLHDFYDWQLRRRSPKRRKKFVLLDGPPYANGSAHVGHAINKVLKDFIVKSRALDDYEVEYRPGWDCHGLPIELKIRKEDMSTDTLEVRRRAADIARNAINDQMSAFRRWGVSADWHNYYSTMDSGYVTKQLRIFADLFERGYVYRAFKPVYWSPSSKTALAESELEYNREHRGVGVFFKYHVIDFDLERVAADEGLRSTARIPIHVHALIWTTTPWTLPLNNAVAFSPTVRYALVEFDEKRRNAIRDVFIVAESLVDSLRETIGRPLKVHTVLEPAVLRGLHYRSPMYNELALPMVESAHVTVEKGTGLVHCSYAHGFDDYLIALKQNDRVECYVDEVGHYTRQMGYALEGRDVLGDGADAALNLLKKHVVYQHDCVHSYPYDWRTKRPIIIRSSEQWFIDVSRAGGRCAQAIADQKIEVGAGEHSQKGALLTQFTLRPEWCISRQRVWGVPIPYVTHKETGQTETSAEFIRWVADRMDAKRGGDGGPDLWWRLSASELLADQSCPRSFAPIQRPKEFESGADIMDVWLDSGVAWHTMGTGSDGGVSAPPPVADVVLEGVDQSRGWFQSLMLTSMVARDCSPYKRVLVHGFAVDDDGRKMSKSEGNVVLPEAVTDGTLKTDAVGVDGLRLWVALHAAECVSEVRIGDKVLVDVGEKLTQIRLLLRFILGSLGDDYDAKRMAANMRLSALDRYILWRTDDFFSETVTNYSEYRFRAVANHFLQYLQNPLSSVYINCVRDRLYCGRVGSAEHNAARFTLDAVGRALCGAVAPLLPHLAVEYYQHHPAYGEAECHVALRQPFADLRTSTIGLAPELLNDEPGKRKLYDTMDHVLSVRAALAAKNADGGDVSSTPAKNKKRKTINLRNKAAIVSAPPDSFELLHELYEENNAHCDLAELLGVSSVELRRQNTICDSLGVELTDSPSLLCKRCRRNTRLMEDAGQICARCADAVSALSKPQQNDVGAIRAT